MAGGGGPIRRYRQYEKNLGLMVAGGLAVPGVIALLVAMALKDSVGWYTWSIFLLTGPIAIMSKPGPTGRLLRRMRGENAVGRKVAPALKEKAGSMSLGGLGAPARPLTLDFTGIAPQSKGFALTTQARKVGTYDALVDFWRKWKDHSPDERLETDWARLANLCEARGMPLNRRDLVVVVQAAGTLATIEEIEADLREGHPKDLAQTCDVFVASVRDEADQLVPALETILRSWGKDVAAKQLKQEVQAARARQEADAFEAHLKRATGPVTLRKIDNMTGEEFEDVLARIYEGQGYRVRRTPITGDQGADLILEHGSWRVVVQAKRYSKPVGNSAVQEAASALRFYGATRAIVVTNNTFTPSAEALAQANGVELVDRDGLDALL